MSNIERRTLVSAFTEAELKNMCFVWEKRGYYKQGSMNTERVSFEEKYARVSRVVYLQLMVMDAIDNTSTMA